MKSESVFEFDLSVPAILHNAVLTDLQRRAKAVGLEMEIKCNAHDSSYHITIFSADYCVYNSQFYRFLDCNQIAGFNRLIERQALENYLNQNYLRMADVGWTVRVEEVCLEHRLRDNRVPALVINTIGDEVYQYPLCAESIYHIEQALYRAEMNRAALRYHTEMQRLVAQEEYPWSVELNHDGIMVESGDGQHSFYPYNNPTALRKLELKMDEFARHAGLPSEPAAAATSDPS